MIAKAWLFRGRRASSKKKIFRLRISGMRSMGCGQRAAIGVGCAIGGLQDIGGLSQDSSRGSSIRVPHCVNATANNSFRDDIVAHMPYCIPFPLHWQPIHITARCQNQPRFASGCRLNATVAVKISVLGGHSGSLGTAGASYGLEAAFKIAAPTEWSHSGDSPLPVSAQCTGSTPSVRQAAGCTCGARQRRG